MANQRSKGEHYLPRAAYLKYFEDTWEGKDLLWVYEFNPNGINLQSEKRIPSKNLCKEKYLYEAPTYPVNAIEQFLESIESAYNSVMQAKILHKERILPQEKSIISLFVSTLEARNPVRRENWLGALSAITDFYQQMENQFNEGKKTEEHKEIDDYRHSVFADTVKIAAELNRWQFSSFYFLHKSDFLEPRKGGFLITSDDPVTIYDFTLMNQFGGIPPLSVSAEVLVPLTPSILLFINNRGIEGYGKMNLNFISEANNRILGYANKRIISPFKIQQESADRFIRRHRQSFILEYETGSVKS